MSNNILLANIIKLFHILVVLFVILGPLINYSAILILHITFCITLLVHWYGNSDVCSLSIMESQLRGLNYTETFTYKFIGPIYKISESTWNNITYYIVFFVMFISLYRLINNNHFKKCYSNYKNGELKLHEFIFCSLLLQ